VTVNDILPTDPPSGVVVAAVSSVVTSHGACFPVVNGEFSCNIGLLAVGSTATITAGMSINLTPTPTETDLDVLQLSSVPTSVTRGNPITVNVDFVNHGPSTATGVMVTTRFSRVSGLIEVRSMTSTQGTCSSSAGGVVCTVGTLLRNAQKRISIVIVPPSPGQLAIETQIEGIEWDPSGLIAPENNTKSVTVQVN
jgi:hypothetical protein